MESLPPRERGLKSHRGVYCYGVVCVAPPAGAWVEMEEQVGHPLELFSRSPRGSVG